MIATHPRYQYFARAYDLSMTSLEWQAGSMPTPEELDALAAMIGETGARVLIWEAEPPAGAFEATSALGVQNIVFSLLAHPVEGRTFLEAYGDAMTQLAGVDP